MNGFDFNCADQQHTFEIIPAGAIVPVSMSIKPGGCGDGGWFTASKNSDVQMLNCEFTVTEGPYARRKIFQYMVLSGGKQNEKGESIAGGISRATLRAMLESARNVRPDDMGEAAVTKRRISGWQDFNGLCFAVKVGVEKGKDGYPGKNKIQVVLTPDMEDYAQVQTPTGSSGSAGSSAPTSSAPAWVAPHPSSGSGTPPPTTGNPAPAWAQ